MPSLPSMKGLQAFEAAARNGSFAAAADELSVSPAAVSQLVRALEEQIGRKLFHRVKRSVVPTEAGLEVLPRLSVAFEELDGVSRRLTGTSGRARITISVPAISRFRLAGGADRCLRRTTRPWQPLNPRRGGSGRLRTRWH